MQIRGRNGRGVKWGRVVAQPYSQRIIYSTNVNPDHPRLASITMYDYIGHRFIHGHDYVGDDGRVSMKLCCCVLDKAANQGQVL
jgi:hypothetical protein